MLMRKKGERKENEGHKENMTTLKGRVRRPHGQWITSMDALKREDRGSNGRKTIEVLVYTGFFYNFKKNL